MKRKKKSTCYEIMHGERKIAEINTRGEVDIFDEKFFPYDLYLEEDRDFDALINNMNNFYHWCASRVLSLDRKYAKEILNSIGMSQAVTDLDRAQISLSYHCVSLTDVFWVKEKEEEASFEELNLYDHSLNEAIVELPLRGKRLFPKGLDSKRRRLCSFKGRWRRNSEARTHCQPDLSVL